MPLTIGISINVGSVKTIALPISNLQLWDDSVILQETDILID